MIDTRCTSDIMLERDDHTTFYQGYNNVTLFRNCFAMPYNVDWYVDLCVFNYIIHQGSYKKSIFEYEIW